jgi:hypothetical protein
MFMRKKILLNAVVCMLLAVPVLQSCKDDSNLRAKAPVADQSFSESFDNVQEAYDKGWRTINVSSPVGRIWYDVTETPNFGSPNYVSIYYPEWKQAQFTLDSTQFPNSVFPQRYWKSAYLSQRASNGYIATSIASAEVIGITSPSVPFNVNNWLISPEMTIQNGDKIIFYTYCKGISRLQLWVNKTNSMNVGASEEPSTGDFNIKLLDINPTYAKFETNPARAYPTEWTRFEGQVTGLETSVKGRFGFRYFLQNQAPILRSQLDPNDFDTLYTQIHRTVVGIDEVTYKSAQ